MKKGKGVKKSTYISIIAVILAVVLGLVTTVNGVMIHWDSVLSMYLGTIGGSDSDGGTAVDTNYFTSEFTSGDALLKAQQEFCLEVAGEGIVLLKNEEALPLAEQSNISLFGISSVGSIRSGSGSGAGTGDNRAWVDAFSAVGYHVNPTLVSFYSDSGYVHGGGTSSGDGTQRGDWKIAEVPQSEYTEVVKASYADYNDAAVIILSRGGGEGGDLPREMSRFGGDADRHFLELTAEEEELIQTVATQNFKKTILIVNTANAMELGFLNDPAYGIDACLWTSGLGADGAEAMGKIVKGEIDPSGKLVDTYVYDNFSSPAMQNFGDYRYVDANGELTGYSYVNYGEGVYVGYKYYETRYEDAVMQTQNVGSYDYASTVLFPFGYGLSYTEFAWSDFSCEVADETVTVSVTVTNVGEQAGKDVVQIYFQSPYTDYDVANKIEKPSVSLVEFAKTSLLPAGGSERVSVSFSLQDMASFDAYGAGTYILENGEYYITAAKDAHSAVNNILSAKGYTALIGDGSADFAYNYTRSTGEALTKYDTGAGSEPITARFADAYVKDYTYLTRSNWAMMDGNGLRYATAEKADASDTTDADRTVGTVQVDEQTLAGLKATGYAATGAPEFTGSADFTYNEQNGLELVDLKGLAYDDAKWDDLLDEMKRSQQHELFGKGGYGTMSIGTEEEGGINKPKTYEYDAPSGISNFVTGARAYSFPAEITLAATWNKDLAERYGALIGEDAIATKTSGWYAPAMNIHRTPFSGRNFEYYSEDATLSGLMAEREVKGVQQKGVYAYIKHFALNDQDTNRSGNGGVATWATEQAIREIYLKPFQYAVERADAHGVMTSVNRIGFRYANNHYPLITQVLRGEWGFEGAVVTDYTSALTGEDADAVLAGGVDLLLCTSASKLTNAKEPWASAALRRAAHNVLFVQANSLAMNGLTHGTTYSTGFPIYALILIALDAVALLAAGWGVYLIVRAARMNADQWQTRKRFSTRTNLIIVGAIAAIIVGLIIYFCVVWLPIL